MGDGTKAVGTPGAGDDVVRAEPCQGFIAPANGAVKLRRILIPVD